MEGPSVIIEFVVDAVAGVHGRLSPAVSQTLLLQPIVELVRKRFILRHGRFRYQNTKCWARKPSPFSDKKGFSKFRVKSLKIRYAS